jgi:protein SCO1/2
MRRLVTLTAVAVALGVLVAGCGGGSKTPVGNVASKYSGAEFTGRPAAPGFTLRDQNGRKISLASQRGRFVFITFLYTHCPDVCPLIATHLSDALERFPAARRTSTVLAVSTDPRRDTPAAAREFVRSHALVPEFHFLVGNKRELARVWKAYHVAVIPGKEIVGHTNLILLLDRRGRERLLYDSRTKPSAFNHDLRVLMNPGD